MRNPRAGTTTAYSCSTTAAGLRSRLARPTNRSGSRSSSTSGLDFTPEEVRALRDRLAAQGVGIVEQWDEPGYVSVKCLDPDGYVVEAAWEPQP
jgi:hypothetical protein